MPYFFNPYISGLSELSNLEYIECITFINKLGERIFWSVYVGAPYWTIFQGTDQWRGLVGEVSEHNHLSKLLRVLTTE